MHGRWVFFCKPHFLNITISSLLQEQNLEKVLITWQAANMCQTTNECVTYYEKVINSYVLAIQKKIWVTTQNPPA